MSYHSVPGPRVCWTVRELECTCANDSKTPCVPTCSSTLVHMNAHTPWDHWSSLSNRALIGERKQFDMNLRASQGSLTPNLWITSYIEKMCRRLRDAGEALLLEIWMEHCILKLVVSWWECTVYVFNPSVGRTPYNVTCSQSNALVLQSR